MTCRRAFQATAYAAPGIRASTKSAAPGMFPGAKAKTPPCQKGTTSSQRPPQRRMTGAVWRAHGAESEAEELEPERGTAHLCVVEMNTLHQRFGRGKRSGAADARGPRVRVRASH